MKASSPQVLRSISPALKALIEGFIDYAGVFPPASVTLETAIANFSEYRGSDFSWILRWLVVDASALPQIPQSLNHQLSLLSDKDQERAATIETKSVVKSSRPVYCEVALQNLEELNKVKEFACFAKIRTGGLKPEAIPSLAEVAKFIVACAELKLPFKATAGLHHPIRAEHALTYSADAPRAVMHGFLNVLIASAFAWHGERDIEAIIAEMDPSAFKFDDSVHWRDKSLTASQIADARSNFIHSVGSCSFTEPVEELKALGLI